jgi:hypothetical protein
MNRPLHNGSKMPGTNWTGCGRKSPRRALGAMTLALMLGCAGCSAWRSRPALLPSVHQGPLGNAALMTLPAGTELRIQRPEAAHNLGQAFVNEMEPVSGGGWQLRTALRLCTPAYLAERDQRELELMREIQRLKIK